MLSTNKRGMKRSDMTIFTVISFGDKNFLRKQVEGLYLGSFYSPVPKYV